MRLKTFTADSMKLAMIMIREELGEESIIVSSQRGPNGRGIRVTAAIEQQETSDAAALEAFGISGHNGGRDELQKDSPGDGVESLLFQTLEDHGTPREIIDRLLNTAGILGVEDSTMALAAALDDAFRFAPFAETENKAPLMLVGPPGVGKTVAVAKLATRAVMNKQRVRVITTDTVRAGGIEQLDAFMRILKIDLAIAETPKALKEEVGSCTDQDIILIDSPGANPFQENEMDELRTLVNKVSAEPVLVLSAGGDAVESSEIADSFKRLGTARLLVTRLDLAKRLGSLLAAAYGGRLRFSEVSITPNVGECLTSINPVALARILLPGTVEQQKTHPQPEDFKVAEASL